MSKINDLKSLRERVLAASGPDRELDREIYVAVHGWKLAKVPPDAFGENACEIYTPYGKLYSSPYQYPTKGKLGQYYHVPDCKLSGSIDAALALVERMLPGWRRAVDIRPEGRATAWVDDGEDGPSMPSVAATPPLAILAALLSALIAQEEAKEAGR